MRTRTPQPPVPAAPGPPLPELLEDWVSAGLISPEQARSIRTHEAQQPGGRTAPATPATASLVVEALGYLGAVIMVVGAVILVNLYWSDLSTPVRLVLLGATAVALVAAGSLVPDRLGEAAARLRSVLWAAAVAATATFAAVFAGDVLDRQDESSLLVVGVGSAVVAAILWWLRRTWLQQLALLVPLVLTGMGLGYEVGGLDTSWSGGFVWIIAAVWSATAWAGLLAPRVTGVAMGALVAAFASLSIANDIGIVLGLLTAVVMVALALHERSLPWLGVAAIATLYTTPRAATEWFPGRLSAALTLMVTGGLLVGAAVWVARHQGVRRPPVGPVG